MPAVDNSTATSRTQGPAPTATPATGGAPEAKQVPINDLDLRFGWKPDSWQHQLLQEADGAGDKDGNVSVAELNAYMANPTDIKFVNSERLQQMRGDLGDGKTPKRVDSFKPGFERTMAQEADKLGNKDGKLTANEFNTLVNQMKQRTDTHAAGPTWMPDQKEAAFASRIADATGEKDFLVPGGEVQGGKDLFKDYMRI